MGKRVGVILNHLTPDDGEHECDKCGMKKAVTDNGCCHDEEVVIKGAQDALSGIANIQIILNVADLPVSHYIFSPEGDSSVYASTEVTSFQPNGPPGYAGPPLFIRNCAFLI